MGKRAPKLDAGDLLAIPLADGRFAVAQIILPGVSFYLAVDPTPRESLETPNDFAPKFFAWTNDAEVYRGNWPKLADRLPIFGDFPKPNFKVSSGGRMVVETFEGQLLRDFVPGQDDALSYRSSLSPLLVQSAVDAMNGFGEWLPMFDELLASEAKND
jgi:hypothetical protein